MGRGSSSWKKRERYKAKIIRSIRSKSIFVYVVLKDVPLKIFRNVFGVLL